MDLLVLGAGPCGLMTAVAARRAGYDVTVLEAEARVGGMSGSFEVAGVSVDFGSHRLHPATDRQTLTFLQELLGDDLHWRDRNGRIRLHDRWVGFPLRTGDMMRHLPPSFTVRAVRDTLTGPFRRSAGDGSFDAEIRRRLGPAVADDFYGPYARKLYGADPADLSAELADRRVAAGSPIDIVRKAVAGRAAPSRRFLYPRKGYGQIVDALAATVVDLGGDIRCSTPVGRISLDGRQVVTADGAVHAADVIVSTIPMPALLRAMGADAPPSVVADVAVLRTRGMVFVYLVLDQPQYTPFDAHYLPGADLTVARLSEPKNYRSSADDLCGVTVLCAEVACWPGDELWSASDADLGALVVDDLARAELPPARPVAVETRRLPSVYPVYEPATAAARRRVESWTAEPPAGLVTTGRQGLGVPDNLHHVLSMAQGTVGALGPEGVDRTAWRARLDEFATHVVQD